ncbi:MAG TPA: hypothetical protein VGQ02_12050 [Candidatus Limnocylindrales bacterium]|nr:hypothetical protein [Candidatus Limnocylindrales bacterium]
MRLLLPAVLAVTLIGCGSSGAPTTVPSAPPSSDPGAAIDTDALVAAAAAKDGQIVRVKGFFLASGGRARLCSVVLESYPPQCGGRTVAVSGEVPADVLGALEKTTDPALAQATWGWVEATGTFHLAGDGGGPTIALSSIRIAAP